MARRYSMARNMVSPVYAGEQQAIESQVPSVQALYDTLVSGLQASGAAGTQRVMEGASRAGVDRAASDVAAVLEEAVALGGAQLGRQQAGDIADIRGSQAQLGMGRVGAISDVESALQERAIQSGRAKLQRQELKSGYKQDLLAARRQDELTRKEAAISRARGGGGSGITVSEDLEYVAGLWEPGPDEYVSPGQWNSLRDAWVERGRSASTFDREFGYLVNPAHQYRKSGKKLGRYKGQPLKNRPKG